MKTEKKCRGIGKALDHGCGEMIDVERYGKANRKFGLGISCGCYKLWLLNTDEGLDIISKQSIKSSGSYADGLIKAAEQQKREKAPLLHSNRYRGYLQDEINKLSRMIDILFGHDTCIDCNKPFTQAMDRDAGHFKSKGHNLSLRYNLHNVHSQKSSCNSNGLGGGKSLGYYRGLVSRYGENYAEFVDKGMQIRYHYLGLKNSEIPEKLKIVRGIIKNFETFDFVDSIQARQICNKIIGLYTEDLPPL
tara:strand:+ start:332 stop:1075 length:744 start_codon:yes stop_codon:yes gene_type:complete